MLLSVSNNNNYENAEKSSESQNHVRVELYIYGQDISSNGASDRLPL
jgi:hypothetical protein